MLFNACNCMASPFASDVGSLCAGGAGFVLPLGDIAARLRRLLA